MGVAVRMACLDAADRATARNDAGRRMSATPQRAALRPASTPASSIPRAAATSTGGAADRATARSPSSARSVIGAGAPDGAESIDCARPLPRARPRRHARRSCASPARSTRRRWRAAASPRRPAASPRMVVLPNTEPPIDDVALVEFVARRAREVGLAQHLRLRRGDRGAARAASWPRSACSPRPARSPSPTPTMPIADAQVMRRALYYAAAFDALIVQQPEEPSLAAAAS